MRADLAIVEIRSRVAGSEGQQFAAGWVTLVEMAWSNPSVRIALPRGISGVRLMFFTSRHWHPTACVSL